VVCLLRGAPLLFAASPRTPLRVLCLAAIDTILVVRHGRPLPSRRRRHLAAFLDLQACANAAWDGKPLADANCLALHRRVNAAGLGTWMSGYLGALAELEAHRPPIGGDRRRFDAVRAYREAVMRLALGTVAAIAFEADGIGDGVRATAGDGDLDVLFRLAMQCQVIDDLLDYEADRAAALPSFLTAAAPLPDALAWTIDAARSYGRCGDTAAPALWPLRAALRAVTAGVRLAVILRRVSSRAARSRCSTAPASRPAATR
jgi:hypothetical protein